MWCLITLGIRRIRPSGMGVRGAALASVIAEASSLLFFLLYTYYKVDLKNTD